MKHREKVIKHSLRHETTILENQFGFRLGLYIMEFFIYFFIFYLDVYWKNIEKPVNIFIWF